MLLSGYKKMLLTFSEVKRVSSIVKLYLTFWKVKSGKGGVQRSDPKKRKQQKQQHKHGEQRKQTTSRTSSSKLHKQHIEHQAAATQGKNTKMISKSSKRSSKNSTNSSKSSALRGTLAAVKAQHKQSSKRHQGPEGGPKVSLCSQWRLLVEFRRCFESFFF